MALLQGRGGAVGSGRDLEELEVDCYTWHSRRCPSVCMPPTTLVHVTVSFTLSTTQSGMTLKLSVKQFLHPHVVTKSGFHEAYRGGSGDKHSNLRVNLEHAIIQCCLILYVQHSIPHSDTSAVVAAYLTVFIKSVALLPVSIHVCDQSDVAFCMKLT